MPKNSYVTLSAEFCAGHFYEQKKWPPQKNREFFGKCYSPYGHGHNYRVEATFEISDKADISELQKQISDLAETFDHRHLNHDIPEFKEVIPTTENIAIYFAQKIKSSSPPSPLLKKLRLFESSDLLTELSL
ncbi:MAG: 6-carboxytetrahydropterin synthase [Pseudobdellovibrionaceae bacterium]